MKSNFLESIGSALFAVFGPVHDAILSAGKPNSPYITSNQLAEWKQSEDSEATNPEGIGPFPVKTLYAYVGGVGLVTVLAVLLSCGKLIPKKKRTVRRRRPAAKTTRRRTYKRRR